MRLRPPAILPLSLPPTELDANRPWWKRIEHQLDGVSPSFFLSPKRQRHAVNNRAASLAEMVNVQNNSAIRTYIDKDGVLQTAPANKPRINWSFGYPRLLLEGAATNYLPHSAVPSSWSSGRSAGGVTVTRISTGVENGLPYADFRLAGEATNSSIDFEIGGASRIPCVSGEIFTVSVFARLLSGVLPSGVSASVIEVEEAAGQVYTGHSASSSVPSGGSMVRLSVSRAMGSSAAFCRVAFLFSGLTGKTVDFVVRLYAPQHEKSPSATSFIATTGTVLTRTADLATLHASAGDMTAWAWRGYVPSLIAGQNLLGISAGIMIGCGVGDPSQVRIEGNSGNLVLAAKSGVIPGDVRFCGGFGTSGRRASDNGSLASSDAAMCDRSRAEMFIGRASGLVAGQVIYLDELVAWVLPDRPSAAGVQSQARAAA